MLQAALPSLLVVLASFEQEDFEVVAEPPNATFLVEEPASFLVSETCEVADLDDVDASL